MLSDVGSDCALQERKAGQKDSVASKSACDQIMQNLVKSQSGIVDKMRQQIDSRVTGGKTQLDDMIAMIVNYTTVLEDELSAPGV